MSARELETAGRTDQTDAKQSIDGTLNRHLSVAPPSLDTPV